MQHAWAYATEQRLREENEDSFGVFQMPGYTLLLVCDGMGGHAGGAQASALAVRTIWERMYAASGEPLPQALDSAITAANKAINEASKKSRRLMGMGTTVVAVAIQDEKAYVAHVGDSRVFLIRDGQAKQLTRDHTMVNLFVDAELLSPEEAASHPEAHVLARSLGVEKVVEVEQHTPISLQPRDTFVLCSDGVHGVIEDWELAEVPWAEPQEAVRNVMWTVREREGDDNATIAVVTMGADPALSAPTTEVPDAIDLEDGGTSAAGAGSPHAAPAPPPISQAPAPVLPTPSIAMPTSSIAKPKVDQETAEATQTSTQTRGPRDRKLRKKKSSHGTAALFAGVMVATALGLLVAVVIKKRSAAPKPPDVGTPVIAAPITPPQNHTPDVSPGTDVPGTPANQQPDVVPDTPAVVPQVVFQFAPQKQARPRRKPHRAAKYTNPPPSGVQTQVAVGAARSQRCAESLDLVREAMAISNSYAQLYGQSWECFQSKDVAPLLAARPTTVDELAALDPHFRGQPPEESPLPDWFVPASAGIEYRLNALMPQGPNTLYDVMLDYRGPENLADDIVDDVLMEALAARAYASAVEPSESIAMAWARRVYHTQAVLEAPIGKLIQAHRPEVYNQVVQLITEATTPPTSPEGEPAPEFPEVVLTALATARGELPPPEPPKPKPVYVPPPPPPPPPVDPLSDGKMPQIFRPPGG